MSKWGSSLGTSDSGLSELGLGTDLAEGEDSDSPDAWLATGTGAAHNASVNIQPNAFASGSGTANNASVHIKPTAQFDANGSVPTVVNWGAFTSGAGAPSVAHPASLAAGDLLVFFVTVRNTGLLSANTGAGWAEHPDSPVWNGSTSGTAGAAVHVFYKIATGSESGSIGGWGTASEYVGRMGAFRGVNQTDPFNVTASNSTTGSASPASLPAAVTTVANTLVLIALGIGTATAPAPGAMSNSVLTSQTNVGSQNTTSDNDAYLNIQHGINASAGGWGATTISKNTNSGYAIIGISIWGGTLGGGAGRAYDAVGFESGGGTSAPAEVATGSGTANSPRALVGPRAEVATGTGAALDADTVTSVAQAEVATGSGVAYGAAPSVAVSPGAATGTGEAYDATTPSEATEVDAEVATGTGAALGPSLFVVPRAGLASGTGAAYGATTASAYVFAFGLDAEISHPGDTHDRTLAHFGTQPDTTITTTDVLGPLPIGTTLDEVLAYLYGEVENLDTGTYFGLSAYIDLYFGLDAVIYEELGDTYDLDAWIVGGASFGLNAVVREITEYSLQFGLYAIVNDPSVPWNLVRTPLHGATATYTAISSVFYGPPSYAADGQLLYDFGEQFGWEVATSGATSDWWQVTWSVPQTVDRVILYDGANGGSGSFANRRRFGNTGSVQFSDGSSVSYSGLNNTSKILDFSPRQTTWIKVVSSAAGGINAGLQEVEAFNTDQWG